MLCRQLAGMPRRGSEERLLTASSAARQHLPSSALAHAHAAAQDQHGGITSPAVASVTGIPMSEVPPSSSSGAAASSVLLSLHQPAQC